MTREEAKLEINFNENEVIQSVIKKIDKIYDDFESRTCENCKFKEEEYVIDDRTLTQCYNESSLLYMTDLSDTDISQTHESFGCNKWKSK